MTVLPIRKDIMTNDLYKLEITIEDFSSKSAARSSFRTMSGYKAFCFAVNNPKSTDYEHNQ